MKIILCFILSSSLAYSQDVKVVKKGEVVPFDGVLFTKELEKDIRNDVKNLEKRNEVLTKLNEVNNKEIDILNNRLELYQKKSKELAEREVKSERETFFKNTFYFISGALLTGLIGYGVVKTYR